MVVPAQAPHASPAPAQWLGSPWWIAVKSLSRVRLFATPGTAAPSLLWRWNSPVRNAGVGCHFLQGILLTQGSNPCLLNWQMDSWPQNQLGSPTGELYSLSGHQDIVSEFRGQVKREVESNVWGQRQQAGDMFSRNSRETLGWTGRRMLPSEAEPHLSLEVQPLSKDMAPCDEMSKNSSLNIPEIRAFLPTSSAGVYLPCFPIQGPLCGADTVLIPIQIFSKVCWLILKTDSNSLKSAATGQYQQH